MADASLDDVIAKRSINAKGRNMNQTAQKQFQGKIGQRPNFRPGFAAKQNRPGAMQQKRPISAPNIGKQSAGPKGGPAQNNAGNLGGKGSIDARDMITIKNRIKISDARAKIIQKRLHRGNMQAQGPPGQPQMNPRPLGPVPGGPFIQPPQIGFQPRPRPPGPPGQQRFQQPPRQPGPPFQQPRPLMQPGPRMNPQRPPQLNQPPRPPFNQPQPFNRPQGPPLMQQPSPQFEEMPPPDFNPDQGMPFNQQIPPDVDQGAMFTPDQGPPLNQGLPMNQQGPPFSQEGPPFNQPGPPFNQQGPPFSLDQSLDIHQQGGQFQQEFPPFGMDGPPHFGQDQPPQFGNQPDPVFRPPGPQFNQQRPQFNPSAPRFNRPPPPQMNPNQPPPNFHQAPPGMNQPPPGVDQGQQMFNQPPPGMNQPPLDFNQPPPNFNQPPPDMGQPDFMEPSLEYEEMPEEDYGANLEYAPEDQMAVGGTFVEDTGSSLKITRSIPDVMFDGQNLTVTRRVPPRGPPQPQIQPSFMDSGYPANVNNNSAPIQVPKKKFKPIPIQAPAPEKTSGPSPIAKNAPTPIQAPNAAQVEAPSQVSFTRDVAEANALAPGPPSSHQSRLKPPPCISNVTGPTQLTVLRDQPPAQNRAPALSRIQQPAQSRGSALSRLQMPSQDQEPVFSYAEQPPQNRVSRMQQPSQNRGSVMPRVQQSPQERGSALSRVQLPAQERGSALSRIQQTNTSRGSALSRIQQPPQDRGSALSRIQQPPEDRGSALSRIQQPAQDRGSALSRIQQPNQERGSVFSRVGQQDQRVASSRIQTAPQNIGLALRGQAQSPAMTSRQSSGDIPMTKRLATHITTPSHPVSVPHSAVAMKAPLKRSAPMSLSERFGSAGAGNPIPVITDQAPVKKRRSTEPLKTEPEDDYQVKEQYMEQEDQGVTVLSPLQGYRVFVSNLHTSVTQDDIIELFGVIGPLKRANLLTKGQAEVAFIHKDHALAALKTYHNRELDGQPMFVKLMTPLNAKVMKAPSSEDTTQSLPASLRSSKPPAADSAPVEIPLIHKALFKTATEAAPTKPVRFTVKL